VISNINQASTGHAGDFGFGAEAPSLKLSICIATYSRARFIGQTIDSILTQLEPGVELLIVDGASPDNTADVMAGYLACNPCIRYYRENENSGIDGDYDKAVSYAHGDYCWLMTDDDLLKPGAVRAVLNAIGDAPDLIVINSEVANADYSSILTPRFVNVTQNKRYEAKDSDALFADTAGALSFIGCIVIRRETWLARLRSTYFGTLFVHVGVIFQAPLLNGALLIAEPLISIRYGNAMWTARGFEIWMFKWPELIWSFDHIAVHSRSAISVCEPWRQFRKLLLYRAIGGYGLDEYRRFFVGKVSGTSRVLPALVARLPAGLANTLAGLYCMLFARRARSNLYDLARSTNATWVSRIAARVVGIDY